MGSKRGGEESREGKKELFHSKCIERKGRAKGSE